MKNQDSPQINLNEKTIRFSLHDDLPSHVSYGGVSQVSLAGSFNNWAKDVLLLEQDKEGVWNIDIPLLPEGKYQYKFFVDDKIWTEDIDNPNREPDGSTGFTSIFTI